MLFNLPINVYRDFRADDELMLLQKKNKKFIFHCRNFSKYVEKKIFPYYNNFIYVISEVSKHDFIYKKHSFQEDVSVIAIGVGM